jgi:transcriptional regulator with XRE-family HTH domain
MDKLINMETTPSYEEALEAALATEIRVEIVRRGTTQQELADSLGMAKATLNRYLKGHNSMPLATLSRVARLLGTSAHELMARAESRISE